MTLAESIHQILSRNDLVTDLFYLTYFERYPDIQTHFDGVDMEQQAVLLKMALTTIQQYYDHDYPAAEQYLLVLGHKHHLRRIPQDLYADWRDCMLDTLERYFEHMWSEDLEDQWTEAINNAIDVMCRGYREFPLNGDKS
ncbi:MAG: globin [Planctomycetaceae bacterium]|nr:globin [Planctomycetaceae bacterium]